MKLRTLLAVTYLLVAGIIAGCGGGGSSTTTSGSTPPPTGSSTIVSGVASKGIIYDGWVKVYSVASNGTVDTTSISNLLAAVRVNANGEYQADIGTYTGPVLVIAYGKYLDEATGIESTISESKPLRAALADARGTAVAIAVTPLTELAVQRAGTLTSANITAANALVSDIFKVDIINTKPVKFELATLNVATTAAKDYTLALAAISQLASAPSASLASVLTTLGNDLTSNTLTPANANGFTSALSEIMNKTKLAVDTTTNLWTIGSKTAVVKLALSGTAALIKGIQISVLLPAGVSVKAGLDGRVESGVVVPSGVATNVKLFDAAYKKDPSRINIALANTSGFAVGEFATINCDLAAGTIPKLSDFTYSGLVVSDADGEDISSKITVTMSSTSLP